jgi:uncharacterized membrane protein
MYVYITDQRLACCILSELSKDDTPNSDSTRVAFTSKGSFFTIIIIIIIIIIILVYLHAESTARRLITEKQKLRT